MQKSSPPTNLRPAFYRPNALPVAHPTVSKHWRERSHYRPNALPVAHPTVSKHWGERSHSTDLLIWSLVWQLHARGLPWGRVTKRLVDPLVRLLAIPRPYNISPVTLSRPIVAIDDLRYVLDWTEALEWPLKLISATWNISITANLSEEVPRWQTSYVNSQTVKILAIMAVSLELFDLQV